MERRLYIPFSCVCARTCSPALGFLFFLTGATGPAWDLLPIYPFLGNKSVILLKAIQSDRNRKQARSRLLHLWLENLHKLASLIFFCTKASLDLLQ